MSLATFIFQRNRRYASIDVSSEKSSISDGEDSPLKDGALRHLPARRSQNGCLLVLVSLLAIALAVGLTIVSTLYLRLVRETAPREMIHCGNSIEEAINRGCSFDPLSKAWLPAACPRYGTDEFVAQAATLNHGPWQYWTGPSGPEITVEQMELRVQNNPGERWSWAGTDREHMAHCAWLIIRLAHAQKVGDRIDVLTANFEHTKHCTLMMLDRAMSAPNLDDKITRGDVIFGSC